MIEWGILLIISGAILIIFSSVTFFESLTPKSSKKEMSLFLTKALATMIGPK